MLSLELGLKRITSRKNLSEGSKGLPSINCLPKIVETLNPKP